MKHILLSLTFLAAIAFAGCGGGNANTQDDNPCGNPCAENPCGGEENPCAGGENPCAGAENPCAGGGDNPCAGNPCNPCGGNW